MDRHIAMETFVRVIETGSFSAAAKQLNVGQPSVSKVISQLEQWVGVKLLLRSSRSLTPTEAGLNFYHSARRAIEEVDEAVATARGAGSELSGSLRVSASVCFGRLHIIRHLPRFLAEHPDLQLDMILDDRPINLLEEGVDVAIRSGNLPNSMVARKIGQAPRRVFATQAYFDSHPPILKPADLRMHNVVIYPPDGGGRTWIFGRDGVEEKIDVDGRLKVTAAEGLREAVLADIGIGVTSEWTFAPEYLSGEVTSRLDDWRLPTLDLWAVFSAGRMASAKARAFATFVQDCVSDKIGGGSATMPIGNSL
ncbi:LysR family transcriptional regulator [Mesorhizobium sp.]|uniref:LysR family transcriptional regulator n=1 Tax=Mesorhizobium sp. TaxID=1871066 RepID=UPI000FE9333A|nr:LysR family transcriptional regulator [Mesorhizobium sp.]RWE79570.1 MAG: LysR family transcriptional regulator [Mesorhizobium sp.]